MPDGFLDFKVSSTTRPDGHVTVRVEARGRGVHRFAVRADNLSLSKAEQQLDLGEKHELVWEGKVTALDAAWVAVVIPNGDLSAEKRSDRRGRTMTGPLVGRPAAAGWRSRFPCRCSCSWWLLARNLRRCRCRCDSKTRPSTAGCRNRCRLRACSMTWKIRPMDVEGRCEMIVHARSGHGRHAIAAHPLPCRGRARLAFGLCEPAVPGGGLERLTTASPSGCMPTFRASTNIGLLTAIDTAEKDNGLGAFGRDSKHYFNLKNHRWTRVIWEIAHVQRAKVTEFSDAVHHDRKAARTPPGEITLDIDDLELQRVEPDHSEGWSVAPGAISYSYSGYQTGAEKTAISSDFAASDFRLIRGERARSSSRSRCATRKHT